jgi:hypothetical protein
MIEVITRYLRGGYVRLLEEEVARERAENERLRAENRALMNSLLGTAGFPPVDFPAAPEPQTLPRLRKRSWHQVQAWREAEASRTSPEFVEMERKEAMNCHVRTNGPVPHS